MFAGDAMLCFVGDLEQNRLLGGTTASFLLNGRLRLMLLDLYAKHYIRW
jgi:hypothetical protein